MSDEKNLPPSDLEPERLIAAADVDPSAADKNRIWEQLETRLTADESAQPTARSQELGARSHAASHEPGAAPPIQRRWWIEALTGIAAFLLFALMLGRGGDTRTPEKHTPGADDGQTTADEERDPTPLLDSLRDDKQNVRRQAFLALLRGGKKTRTAVRDFKSGNDAEQNRAVDDLRRGYELMDKLGAASASETLPFWQALWDAEASVQPEIWDIGLELNAKDPQPAAAPSALVADALIVKYGENQGGALKERFAAAFETLRSFQQWSRKKSGQNTDRLKDIAIAGVAVAPVVLKTLALDLAEEYRVNGRPPGEKNAYPEDHLRMMAAAVATNLHEAEPLIMKFVPDYPLSGTIQGNAINAMWRLAGRTDRPFPLDVAIPTEKDVAEIQTWWREKHGENPKGKFDAQIDALLHHPGEAAATEAFDALLLGGAEARAAAKAHESEKELKPLFRAFEIMDKLGDDTESLAFWQTVWDGEAQADPWLWGYGVNAEGTAFPGLAIRESPPGPLMTHVLRAKIGKQSATEIGDRFAAAFDAYVAFRKWERDGLKKPANPLHERLLKAIEDAGVAVAPPILKLLSEPVANEIHNQEESKRLTEIEAGKIPPLPTSLDHLRMIVAADRLKLHEAEPILMEKIALSYPLSRTIQEHAVAAIYRLHGNTAEIKHFPFDITTQDSDFFARFCAWWLEEKTKALHVYGDVSVGRQQRANAEIASITTQILPKIEVWRDLVSKDEKYHEVAVRLNEAMDAFRKINTQHSDPPPPKRKGNSVGEGDVSP